MSISDFFYNKMLSVLNEREQSGAIPTPATNEPIEKSDGELFTFVVFGDPQVSNYMFARECCFYGACKDIKNQAEPIDALLVAGDVTENGLKCEFRMVSHILNGISDKVSNIFLIPGNHDIRLRSYKKQLKRFCNAVSSIKNGVVPNGTNYHFSVDFPSCKFIMMGADRASFEAAHISREQLDWLDREIGLAEKENKPAFVFNHQTLKKVHGLPDVWQSNDNWRGSVGRQSELLKRVFENHSNVIFVTGHLHMGVWEKTFEDFGKYKCLSIPTVGAGNHGEFSHDSQGYVISVFEDKIIARARLFSQGKFVDETIPNAKIELKKI